MAEKDRIIELQRQIKIAKRALEAIKSGAVDPYQRADAALYEMMPLDRKYPLQGVVGHGRNVE